MLKKVFILTQFGKPHEWTEKYFENIRFLGQYGWYWKIFTPNKYENVPQNVEIIDMDIEEFNVLMEKKIGLNPHNYLKENGTPSKAVSDFYVASGVIFEDYIKSYDYWGITNWDVVYGRLDFFLPDDVLGQADIFSDDIDNVNGVFSLLRNIPKINNLYKEIPDIEKMLTEHTLFGIDEYYLIEVINKYTPTQDIIFGHPQYFPLHSHDRLENHVPTPKLMVKPDGSLWELLKDVNPPQWKYARPFIGREIMYFHFNVTKKWPF